MALTLVEAAKLSNDALQRGVIETFILESVVLDRLQLIPIEGNSYKYNEEATLPGVEFRAVNSAYVESTGTVNQKTEGLVILGGDADVDKFIVRTRSNLEDQRAVQTGLKIKAARMKFQDAVISGDAAVDANSFDGLKKRLVGAQVIDAGTNGLPVIGADAAAQHSFMDKLDELIAAVQGEVEALYMNKSIRSKIMSSGRRLGGTEWITKVFLEDDDEPLVKRIPTYNGIPMLDIGVKADGTNIIPQTETQGASNVASSIYAVALSNDESQPGIAGLFNGPSDDQPFDVVDLGEIDVKPVYRTRIEGYLGFAVFGKGAARLRGVLNS